MTDTTQTTLADNVTSAPIEALVPVTTSVIPTVSPAPVAQADSAPEAQALPPVPPKVTKTAAKTVVKPVAKPRAKPVAKTPVTAPVTAPVKAAVKAAAKAPLAAPIKAAAKKVEKPAAKPAVKPAKPAPILNNVAVEKPKKAKLVRDSFTIPKAEYEQLSILKDRAFRLKQPVKKSELLRAGIKLMVSLTDAVFAATLKAIPALKTGRPKTEAPVTKVKKSATPVAAKKSVKAASKTAK